MVKNHFVNRILQILVVLFGISLFTFSLTYLSPGDTAEIMLTECGNIPTPELVEQTRAELGLDKPFAEQYFKCFNHFYFPFYIFQYLKIITYFLNFVLNIID